MGWRHDKQILLSRMNAVFVPHLFYHDEIKSPVRTVRVFAKIFSDFFHCFQFPLQPLIQ
jgi:hypothetical protein